MADGMSPTLAALPACCNCKALLRPSPIQVLPSLVALATIRLQNLPDQILAGLAHRARKEATDWIA